MVSEILAAYCVVYGVILLGSLLLCMVSESLAAFCVVYGVNSMFEEEQKMGRALSMRFCWIEMKKNCIATRWALFGAARWAIFSSRCLYGVTGAGLWVQCPNFADSLVEKFFIYP